MAETFLSIWGKEKDITTAQINELLSQGCDINEVAEDGQTPLIKASYFSNDVEVLQLMLDAGANVGARDNMGRTVLFAAIFANKLDNVRFFIQNGASVNARLLNNGLTPLLAACEMASLEIVKLLLDAGAGINTKDTYGYSPIMVAVQANREDVADELLQRGIKIDKDLINFVKTFPAFSKTNVGTKIMTACNN